MWCRNDICTVIANVISIKYETTTSTIIKSIMEAREPKISFIIFVSTLHYVEPTVFIIICSCLVFKENVLTFILYDGYCEINAH